MCALQFHLHWQPNCPILPSYVAICIKLNILTTGEIGGGMANSKKTTTERVQITLDPWVAMMVSGLEARRRFGETKKDVANFILREWLIDYMNDQGISDESAKEWSEKSFY